MDSPVTLDDVHKYGYQNTPSDIELVQHQYPASPYSAPPIDAKLYNESHKPPINVQAPRRKQSLWSLIFMPFFLILAAGIGAGHHFFYNYLHGKPTSAFDPVWAIRIGTAASFIFKTFVAITMGTAYIQRMWASLRKRYFSLPTLDALFGAVEQPKAAIFEGAMWTSAKIALLMAVMTWVLPLAAVLTPATLTVDVDYNATVVPCNVPSGDITNPAFANQLAALDEDGVYTRPTSLLRRSAIKALTGSPVSWPSPCGANCTYSQTFTALYLNCTADDENAGQGSYTLGTNELYAATSDSLITTDTNEPITPLVVEWSSASMPGIGDKRLFCIPRNTTFNIQVTYLNSKQTITVTNHTLGGSPFGIPKGTNLIASGEHARLTMASILDSVYYYISGRLDTFSRSSDMRTSDLISLSTFIQQASSPSSSSSSSNSTILYKFGDVKLGLENIMLNTSLSLISLAASGELSPSNQLLPILEPSTCTQSNATLKFIYKPFFLVVSYGVALGVGLFVMAIGFHARMTSNGGTVGETSFSAVLAATRNESIDAVFNDPNMTMERLVNIKFRFGLLRSGREAFGTREDFGR